MSLSQKPTPLVISNQMSVVAEYGAHSARPDAPVWEDGCTIPRPALRITDPSLWCVGGLVAAAAAWIMA